MELELECLVEQQRCALEAANAALRHSEQMLAVERDSAERLQHVATFLVNVQGIEALYEKILDTTIAILHAHFATIQMFYPERGTKGELRILGYRGFSAEAAKRWEWISATARTICGEALRAAGKVRVPDVRNCGFMAGSEEQREYLATGIHAAQSLPLFSRSGALMGMVSTYWRHPYELSVGEERALDVLARLAADLIERSRGEEMLRESEERLRLAAKATNDAIWDIDLRTGTVTWNETYSALYGRPLETSDSWQWWIDRIHPEDRERTASDLRATIDGSASSWNCEYRFQRMDGGWAFIYDRAYIARDANGSARRVIGAMQDLTGRKQAEARAREAEQRFRKIADAAPVMIWVSGTNKSCTFLNKSWLEYRGRSLEQESGDGWAQGVHPNDLDQCWKIYSSAFDARLSFQMEYRLRRADGEYRWVLDNGVPTFTPDGVFEGYVGSCIDLTELKRAQEENSDRQKLESLGVLAAGIAHDFNNLLGGILVETQLVEEALPAQSSATEEVQKIKDLAIRASEIVRELMVYAGHETAEFEPVDLSMLVAEMLELLKISISKRVVLKTELGNDLPLLRVQPPQIRQLVMNLVTNASEAIGDQEGVITIAISRVTGVEDSPRSRTIAPGDYLLLQVSDTGPGMTEEETAKIFDPFYTSKFAGRGLGLAVVQGVVRAHAGTISLDSAPGQGTSFRIFLPLTQELPEPARQARVSTSGEWVSVATRTVLLVEDEHALREAVAKMLRKRGLVVVEAPDGSTAIDSLRDQTLDIDTILLDLTIPGANSREVVEQAKRSRPEARIVITSAYSRDAAAHFFEVPQVAAYIRKPFLIRDLADVLLKATST